MQLSVAMKACRHRMLCSIGLHQWHNHGSVLSTEHGGVVVLGVPWWRVKVTDCRHCRVLKMERQ